ncbi:hypothetical protein WDW86_06500 [Bdellovibrionota bacterium FG-2]
MFADPAVITLADSADNTVSSSAAASVAAFGDNECNSNANLTGKLSGDSALASDGVATFVSLSYTKTETIYLKYSLEGFTRCDPTAITPLPGNASALAITQKPSPFATLGGALLGATRHHSFGY